MTGLSETRDWVLYSSLEEWKAMEKEKEVEREGRGSEGTACMIERVSDPGSGSYLWLFYHITANNQDVSSNFAGKQRRLKNGLLAWPFPRSPACVTYYHVGLAAWMAKLWMFYVCSVRPSIHLPISCTSIVDCKV
ncbi:hypothetical protein ONS96_011606 [Cadophora gregata f. sp. sojae]|nr:hypothetical protein ONS96_011606 [Cadophora gregata f. sp. sojae]